MDCSPPGSCVHGILQARTLEWVAMPSSRALPDPRMEPASRVSLALQAVSFPLCLPQCLFSPGKPSEWRAVFQHGDRGLSQVLESSLTGQRVAACSKGDGFFQVVLVLRLAGQTSCLSPNAHTPPTAVLSRQEARGGGILPWLGQTARCSLHPGVDAELALSLS